MVAGDDILNIMPLKKIRIVITCSFLLITAADIFFSYQKYREIRADADASKPVLEPGFEFADLKHLLFPSQTIGYFTDLDFSSESINTQNFLSAQYQLAPVVLDVNNQQHSMFLIDASTQWMAFHLAEKMRTEPVYSNPYGKLLARKP